MKKKALIIGCGNIGAMYDFAGTGILTHTKALVNSNLFDVSIFDIDLALSQKIANHYTIQQLTTLDASQLSAFDHVSICSPTHLHHEHLTLALQQGAKTIICEKPVSYTLTELQQIENYVRQNKPDSFILVNYIRRFQPIYQQLKMYTEKIVADEGLPSKIEIRYKRGIINNASHAFDVCNYILNQKLEIQNLKVIKKEVDAFVNDPTITGSFKWHAMEVELIGLPLSHPASIELNLNWGKHKINIPDSGNSFSINNNQDIVFSSTNCLENYMVPVINTIENYYNSTPVISNFTEAIELNKTLLQVLID